MNPCENLISMTFFKITGEKRKHSPFQVNYPNTRMTVGQLHTHRKREKQKKLNVRISKSP